MYMKNKFAGINIADGHEVAVKFTTWGKRNEAMREFQMYFYLNSYKKPEVEQFGIPAVYYYGKWGNFIATAITRLDESLDDFFEEPNQLSNPLDALILIRQFVSGLHYLLFQSFPNIFRI